MIGPHHNPASSAFANSLDRGIEAAKLLAESCHDAEDSAPSKSRVVGISLAGRLEGLREEVMNEMNPETERIPISEAALLCADPAALTVYDTEDLREPGAPPASSGTPKT